MDEEKGVVDAGEKPNSNPESSSPGHDDNFLDDPTLLDIGSFDKETDDRINNSTAHGERHNTSQDAVSSKPGSAESNWPEWSLPPPQGDHGHSGLSLSADHRPKSDNMVLSAREGSTPSTSGTLCGQKENVLNNTPLAREDHHLSSNAAAFVTGRPLLTPPKDAVASNSGTESASQQSKQLAENDLFLQDDFGVVVENLEKEIERLQLSESSLIEENEMRQLKETTLLEEIEELKLENKYLMEQLDRQRQPIHKFLIEFVKSTKSTEDKAHALIQELEAGSFGRGEQRVPKNAVERQNQEESPFAHGAISTTMKVQPASIEVDETDVMLMKLAVLVASRSELSAQGKPSVGCIIYRYGDPSLPDFFSLGWNGFVKNESKIDLHLARESDQKKQKKLFQNCCLHAEMKAVLFSNCTLKKAIVYVTHMPCSNCAKVLCEAGVSRVYYLFLKKDSNIDPFRANKTTSCICFPRRHLILEDFSLDKLEQWGITHGDTDSKRKPEDCESYWGPEVHN